MQWKVKLSRSAEKFIDKNQITKKEVFALTRKAIQFFKAKDINVDIAKLKGKWKGFYRIRKGDLRIIAEFDFENSAVFIEEVDNRGSVYE